MYEAAAADAENGRSAPAPAELDAAAENVGGIRPWGDVEQQTGQDEQPEFMNSEHDEVSPSKRTETALCQFQSGAVDTESELHLFNCITIA
jgi:hypothetical protein